MNPVKTLIKAGFIRISSPFLPFTPTSEMVKKMIATIFVLLNEENNPAAKFYPISGLKLKILGANFGIPGNRNNKSAMRGPRY